jgi:hypothetical protein
MKKSAMRCEVKIYPKTNQIGGNLYVTSGFTGKKEG